MLHQGLKVRVLALGALWLCMSSNVSAAQLKENTAIVDQDIHIPGMAVIISKGNETGCDASRHEKWDTNKGGCSNTEYMKENSQVISVSSSESRLSIGVNESTVLTATVRTKDGQPVGSGVLVSWTASSGRFSSNTSVTGEDSRSSVTFSTSGGTSAGVISIGASAKGGGATTSIELVNSTHVTSLSASPPSVPADGTNHIMLQATLAYENGRSVGAGEPLQWSTNLGNFTYTESQTNPNGQATAYLVSSTPGSGVVTATRNGAAQAQVNFETLVPVAPAGPEILSFSVKGKSGSNGYARNYTENQASFDYDNAMWGDVIFSWTVSGADRYELVDRFGVVHYSGSESSLHFRDKPLPPNQFDSQLYLNASPGRKGSETFTLKAYQGSVVVSKTITVTSFWESCGGGCSM
ncbi:Ig-like domain-containing protein [Pseudomonas sp. RP23018S]|uniref:Ig-like domain-containing protein n=1 Tax=Pseudomonas sp. RP23018S TaxID=3096037 RepID=UPI002ACA243A|nr:Ig-like domain-containing protein [Pseudomonas sp. RP23018S]MDZ5605304.1 Ig-like domain-containing protein [Pseudomonas sp. RP23018S]